MVLQQIASEGLTWFAKVNVRCQLVRRRRRQISLRFCQNRNRAVKLHFPFTFCVIRTFCFYFRERVVADMEALRLDVVRLEARLTAKDEEIQGLKAANEKLHLRDDVKKLVNRTRGASERRESKLQRHLEESKSRELDLERFKAKVKITIAFLRAGSYSKFTQRYIAKRCLPNVDEEDWKELCTLTVAQVANAHSRHSSIPDNLRALIPMDIRKKLDIECRGAGFPCLNAFKTSCWIIANARQRYSAHATIALDTVREAAATLTNMEVLSQAYPEDSSMLARALCTGAELSKFVHIMTGIYGEGHAEALDEFDEYPLE